MFNSIRITLGAIAALLLFVINLHGVRAEEVVTSSTLPPQLTDWSDTIGVDKFDPSLGVLLRVDTLIAGDLLGTARYESLDSSPTDMTVSMQADTELRWPDGPVIITAYPVASRTQPATEFDGEVDFAGTSGTTLNRIVGFDVSKVASFTQTADLEKFIGLDQTLFQIDVTGRSRAQGAGNLSARFTLTTSAAITITYTYGKPAIQIEKSTNGEDADEPTGPRIGVGEPVLWEYVVTNIGDMTLINVVVTDDQGVTVSCPKATLAPAEVMTCTASGVAVVGQYANTGTVVGQPIDLSGSPRGATVVDSDKSHYYGDGDFCPVDVLPEVIYLGESEGTVAHSFVMPEGFDTFIVKRRKPFRFVTPEAELNAEGKQIYNATLNQIERVWACQGNCDFHQALKEELALGFQKTGAHIELLIIDNDVDNRWDWWAAEEPTVPYQLVDSQAMVEIARFDVPFDANWYFYTEDSIGIVSICIVEPPATAAGAPSAAPVQSHVELADQAMDKRAFLPIVLSQ